MLMSRRLIGVFGSSKINGGELADLAYLIGSEFKNRSGHMLTGACAGLPLAAARGAYTGSVPSSSFVLGISPFSPGEHFRRSGMVSVYHDHIIYTGLGDDLDGQAAFRSRNRINALTAEKAIVLPGTAGTLEELEFSLIYGKPVVIVSGIDTVFDDQARDLVARHKRAEVWYRNEPRDILAMLY